MKKKASKLWIAATTVTAVILAVCIAAIPITNQFAAAINVALNAKTQKIIPDPEAKVQFTSDYESEEELVAFEKELCESIEAEGAALLVNNDNTLPLSGDTKFTTFSQSSYNLMYGGTGSGQVSAEDAVTLKDALEESFGKGCVNPKQWDFYANSGYARVNADTTGGSQSQYRINEVPWSEYTEELQNTWSEYGDVALVVLARSGGEGADLPSGLPELEAYMTDGDYLRLCKEETDMLANLQQLKEQGIFKKIVVLLNSSNALQLDFLDSYGVDAVLWIGDVGMTGINGVADILSGAVNPSGRIVDTFLKDNHSAPAMQNFGAFNYTNGADYEVAAAQNNTDPGVTKCNEDYVVYQEGIYVGYRYYETRYEDYVLNRGNAGEYDYTSEDVMAATFNLDIIENIGKCIGEDFLHAPSDTGTVYAGIYGPGANIHRTPYCGRNFEYYSEDGWLSGQIAAVEVAAIQDRGVYVFTKHFALNDQEEGRYGISTWSNEQAIRELYLEGFEGSVAKGGGMGVMSSFNRLGVVWSGAHHGLMTGILRDEWGMDGAAITDCSVMVSFMDYRLGVLAGQDLWDGYSMNMATLDGLENDPAIVAAVQRAVKNIAYSVTHSQAMNIGNATVRPITPWWQMTLYVVTGVAALLTVGSVVMLVRTRKVKTDAK